MSVVRTTTIIQVLYKGKHLSLPNGYTIAMGEDGSIGFIMSKLDANSRKYFIVDDLTFRQLHNIIMEFDLWLI